MSKGITLSPAQSVLFIFVIALIFSLWWDFENMAEFIRDISGILFFVGAAFVVYQLKFLQRTPRLIAGSHILSSAFSYIPLAIGFVAYFTWNSILYTDVAHAILAKYGVVANAKVTNKHYVTTVLAPLNMGYRHADSSSDGFLTYEVVTFQHNGNTGVIDFLTNGGKPGSYAGLVNQVNSGSLQVRFLSPFPWLASPNAEFTDPNNNPPY